MSELIAGLGGGLWMMAAFIIALSIIVAIHEYGHYIVGRWSGIHAETFSLGFGPRLWSRRDRRGTEWQVAAIPLGGYVRFLGDANAASAGPGQAVAPERVRATLDGAPLWARAATVLAGPVFNFILSTVIFAGLLMWNGTALERVVIGKLAPTPPSIVSELQPGDEILAIGDQAITRWSDIGLATETQPAATGHDWRVRRDGAEITVTGPDPMPPRVSGLAPGGAAADAGMLPGDVILAVDGTPLARFDALRERVEAAAGAPMDVQIWREGTGQMDLTLSAREQDIPAADGGFEKRWLIGVTGGAGYFEPATRATGLFEALRGGLSQTFAVISSSLTGLWAMITGQIDSCNLGGAISIAESTGQAASAGGVNFIWWIGILSAAIGFLNLMPVPVLDGGHLMFYAYEAVAGRKPSDRIMSWLTTAGLALVMMLMLFGLSNDLFCP